MNCDLPTCRPEERLLSADTEFPSLKHGTRHKVSRTEKPDCYPDRGHVPDDWSEAYQPTRYVSPVVAAGPEWAEPEEFARALDARAKLSGLNPDRLSEADIARLYPSYEGHVIVNGRPRNPRGPTGLTGQGLLGKHGENTAADPIVFRRHSDPDSGRQKLQMIAIRRRDNGRWAIPGGMTDFGETVSQTLARELREEALGQSVTPEQAAQFDDSFRTLFETKGTLVYQGTVDDFRNTDTSWMASKVQMVELDLLDAEKLGWDMTLQAGDDAQDAVWMDVTAENLAGLNANHGEFVGRAVQLWQEQTGLVVRKDGVLCAKV